MFSVSGVCVCSVGFTGSDCSLEIGAAPNIPDKTNNAACNGNCVTVIINGKNFIKSDNLVCKFTTIQVFTANLLSGFKCGFMLSLLHHYETCIYLVILC